jgi:hypothetical protein
VVIEDLAWMEFQENAAEQGWSAGSVIRRLVDQFNVDAAKTRRGFGHHRESCLLCLMHLRQDPIGDRRQAGLRQNTTEEPRS